MIGETIGSALSVVAMMVAIRRRDDGILTSFLAFVGWLSIIVSRILLFSLVAAFIHHWLVLLMVIRCVLLTQWIYKIALRSHTASIQESSIATPSESIMNGTDSINGRGDVVIQYKTRTQRLILWLMTFGFFGAPSLFFWPIMFQLREHKRPQKFLAIISIENVALLFTFLAANGGRDVPGTVRIVLVVIFVTSLIGILLISFYINVKPKLTDQIVIYDSNSDQKTNKMSYGFYYEFCDIVFKLPSTDHIRDGLEEIRKF